MCVCRSVEREECDRVTGLEVGESSRWVDGGGRVEGQEEKSCRLWR